MTIPTEPIGSIPRPADLVAAWADKLAGRIPDQRFDQIVTDALRDTIHRFREDRLTSHYRWRTVQAELRNIPAGGCHEPRP